MGAALIGLAMRVGSALRRLAMGLGVALRRLAMRVGATLGRLVKRVGAAFKGSPYGKKITFIIYLREKRCKRKI